MSEPIKIAVVEDDDGLNELISRRLGREGHSCVKLKSAAQALDFFEKDKADLMLLDLMLPDSTGEELVAKLQAKGVQTPFIVATGQGSETTAVRLLKQGARDYLVKNSDFLEALAPTVDMVWREIQLESLLAKARERIRLQNATLSAINEFAPDGIIAVLSNGSVGSYNASLLADWELGEEDMAKGAMHVFSAIASKTADPDGFLKAVLAIKESFKGVVLPEIRAGERCFELFSSPIERDGRVWFLHDFTLHKKAEEKLKAANDVTESNARARSRFFALVSHDVRTPLNSVSGFVSLLESTALDQAQKEYVGVIRSSCEHLLVLINDILDLSKIEHGAIELSNREFNPAMLVEESLDTFIPAASESGVALLKEIPPELPKTIVGDQFRLRQILINLIGNAMKFTRKGYVAVACKPCHKRPGFLEFAVRDTGIGIEKDVQKSLFNPFVQANADIARQYGGSGLGLTISKQLVELMGGELSLESAPGEGTTFTFTVPCAPQEA